MMLGSNPTVADTLTGPEGTVHRRVNVVAELMVADCVPELPPHVPTDGLEVTEQELAFTLVADQVMVTESPFFTLFFEGRSESWGLSTTTVTEPVVLPPGEMQVTV